MSYNVPPPSGKPVWPIVVACLVLVIGIAVAAVFVGMNLSDSDQQAAGRNHAPAYATADDDATDDAAQTDAGQETKAKPDKTVTEPEPDETDDADADDADDDESAPDDGSDEPRDDPPETSADRDDPRLACGRATDVLTTRTATFGASICRTADGDNVYRGMSENIKGSLVLNATFDAGSDTWVATNQTYEYTVDAETGHMTIRNLETGEVYGSEPAIKFRSSW